jgi:hypothetical protein
MTRINPIDAPHPATWAQHTALQPLKAVSATHQGLFSLSRPKKTKIYIIIINQVRVRVSGRDCLMTKSTVEAGGSDGLLGSHHYPGIRRHKHDFFLGRPSFLQKKKKGCGFSMSWPRDRRTQQDLETNLKAVLGCSGSRQPANELRSERKKKEEKKGRKMIWKSSRSSINPLGAVLACGSAGVYTIVYTAGSTQRLAIMTDGL